MQLMCTFQLYNNLYILRAPLACNTYVHYMDCSMHQQLAGILVHMYVHEYYFCVVFLDLDANVLDDM